MELREPYKDINRTIQMLREQVVDSIAYAVDQCPKVDTPEQLFKWLKTNVRYKNDPPGYELIQSMPTLFSPFTHKTGVHYGSGQGDCDCFTVTALACMYVQGWRDFGIVLCGRKKKAPVHIFAYINDGGDLKAFDLTAPYYGVHREYKYMQYLPQR